MNTWLSIWSFALMPVLLIPDLLDSSLLAQQISPNPNPEGNNIFAQDGSFNADIFNNFGQLITVPGAFENTKTGELIIESTGNFTVNGQLTNNGIVQNNNSAGAASSGIWVNNGLLENEGNFGNSNLTINAMSGTFNNGSEGSVNTFSEFENYGVVNNSGTFRVRLPTGSFLNAGIFNNLESACFENMDIFDNEMVFVNSGQFQSFAVGFDAVVNNSGIFLNEPLTTNQNDANNLFISDGLNNAGLLDNNGAVVLGSSAVLVNDNMIVNRQFTDDVFGGKQTITGLLENFGEFENNGTFCNDGFFDNAELFVNNGVIDSDRFVVSCIHNRRNSVLRNFGEIVLSADGIENEGSFENLGILTNNGNVVTSGGEFMNSGTVRGNVRIEGDLTDNGVFSPGNPLSSLGNPFNNLFRLTSIAFIQGDYSKTAGTISIELGGTFEGSLSNFNASEFDRLIVTGDTDLSGNLNISLVPNYQLTKNAEFLILETVSNFSGHFDGLDEGAVVSSFGGIDLFITYTAGNGNDIALYTEQAEIGDINLDGSINLLDVAPFIALLTSGVFQIEADVNQDGVVNLLDVAPFVELLIGG